MNECPCPKCEDMRRASADLADAWSRLSEDEQAAIMRRAKLRAEQIQALID